MLVNLNDVLKNAVKQKYAVGLFNTTDTDMLQSAITAAEKLRSPIIIGTAEVLLPYGELSLLAPTIIKAARDATVPVVVHFDHGTSFERCIEALKLGFSSVMFDGSALPYEDNLKATQEMVKIAHAFGASVEGEIGHVGQADSAVEEESYTTVAEAVDFYNKTGVDALAVAIGSAHGVYKHKPKLNIARLKEISNALPIPIVLHGGSGLSVQNFTDCIQNGVAKVNVFTDLCLAGEQAYAKGLQNNLGYLETRNLKVQEITKAIEQKIHIFGSENKA